MFALCNEWAKDRSVTNRADVVGSRERLRTREIDAVLAACRLLVAVSVRSAGAVADQVNLLQLRILAVVSSRPGIGVRDLAGATGLHVSRASRACERMVEDGLLCREEDPRDRRGVRLSVTAEGRSLVNQVASARRRAVRPALQRMTAEQRNALVEALTAFAGSADQPADVDLWAAGWTT
jgi:DNA-binding MarR family transcriptional regulator